MLSFQPSDFERINGYPNNYWGWGLEDDQLGLRMAHNGVRTLRVRLGEFEDLDPVNMKAVLERRDRKEVGSHMPWYNPMMFERGELLLDQDWSTNGLRNLQFARIDSWVDGTVHHCVVDVVLSDAERTKFTVRQKVASMAVLRDGFLGHFAGFMCRVSIGRVT